MHFSAHIVSCSCWRSVLCLCLSDKSSGENNRSALFSGRLALVAYTWKVSLSPSCLLVVTAWNKRHFTGPSDVCCVPSSSVACSCPQRRAVGLQCWLMATAGDRSAFYVPRGRHQSRVCCLFWFMTTRLLRLCQWGRLRCHFSGRGPRES